MSSTNVHSNQDNLDNAQFVGGQVIANVRENEIEMPPKSSGRGPSRLEVKAGEGMEIPVMQSELHKDGKLVTKDGTQIIKFNSKAFDILSKKHKKQVKKVSNKTSKTVKGEDR